MNTKRIMAEKRRLIVPLILAIVANVLLFAVVVFPLGRQVASAEAEASLQRDQLTRARQDLLLAKATVDGKQKADAALQTFYKDVLPGDTSSARKLTFTRLAQLAKQANVQLEHGTNTVTHLKGGSQLSKLTTSYTLTGDYRDVRKFIYSLETTPEFIVLENVVLTSSQGEQKARALAMDIEIATYFRSGDVGE
jgi:type IV pilus assembly protein PilO